MKCLILDRDSVASELLTVKLTEFGHSAVQESAKNKAVEILAAGEFDAVFLDPSPLTSARPMLLDIRRNVSGYPYVFLTTENAELSQALEDGANDIFPKPLKIDSLHEKLIHADRFMKLVRHIGDDSEDFPSAGGVVAKSAFGQLFLSSIDRAGRYRERSYILLIAVANYDDVAALDGAYGVEYSVAKLSQHLVANRRQSDIIAQTARHEFALLLQRPAYESEPAEAAGRFVQSLSEATFLQGQAIGPLAIDVRLIEIPSGFLVMEHIVTLERSEV